MDKKYSKLKSFAKIKTSKPENDNNDYVYCIRDCKDIICLLTENWILL